MLNCRRDREKLRMGEGENPSSPRRPVSLSAYLLVTLLSAFCLFAAGCRRDMQDQPKAIAYRENSFYKDGTGSRPLIEGTVPRGYLRADREFYFGKKAGAPTTSAATPGAATGSASLYPDDVETF